MNLRNPQLYGVLSQVYGRVRVQNAGQPFRYKVVTDERGDRSVKKVSSGEEYTVCCPHCGDTRFRLNVNHVFGTRIEGILMDYVAHCWNEECDVRKEISDAVIRGGGTSLVVGGEAVSGPLSIETMAHDSHERYRRLQGLVRIDQMPEAHPARMYLQGRQLDPNVLGPFYQVCYCADPDPTVRLACRRVIFPIVFPVSGALGETQCLPVGWQARAIPGLSESEKPKYWTSPGCSRTYFFYLFNWAVVAGKGLVIVEGPTDALTIGPPAVATLGRRITQHQQALVVDYWGEGKTEFPIVLIGDNGFEGDWLKNYEELAVQLGSERRLILMIPEADANTLGREEVCRRIRNECAKRGLNAPV